MIIHYITILRNRVIKVARLKNNYVTSCVCSALSYEQCLWNRYVTSHSCCKIFQIE
jgi:hypothetical protein